MTKHERQAATRARTEAADGSGFRAAGLCGAKHPSLRVFCTRTAGHGPSIKHANHYVGKRLPADFVGVTW
ncbi:hypothetical protein AB0M11_26720 [Streptomyces sp. NPDC051987]|uniref:hypothetical protein n=1 Tax=Streptomyces sp. NPDC051987 TaxID=3155808 RepID=UPI0034385A6D